MQSSDEHARINWVTGVFYQDAKQEAGKDHDLRRLHGIVESDLAVAVWVLERPEGSAKQVRDGLLFGLG